MMEGTTHIPGITALVAVLIVGLLIERVASGILFLLGFWKAWAKRFPVAARRGKLAYFAIATLTTVILMAATGIRLFGPLGFSTIPVATDKLLTLLVLVAASDRLTEILKLAAGHTPESESSKPIEVKGTVIIEEPDAKHAPASGLDGVS